MKKRWTLLAVAVAAALVALIARPKRHEDPAAALHARELHAQTARAQKVARVLNAARTLRLRHLPPVASPADDVARYRRLADNPLPAKQRLRDGAYEWSPTVLKLEDRAWNAEKRRECGRLIGYDIERVCNYTIDMVLERTGAGAGTVKFARARVRDEEPEPACQPFADCIADIRVNEQLPLPPGGEREIAISQNLQSTPPPAHMLDVAVQDQVIAELKLALEQFKQDMDPGSPKDRHHLAQETDFLNYHVARVEELRRSTATAR
jgi:hypothetical protein